ncbi:MAG: YqaJ viral recombinase family protein [Gemmatimonadetes bacterium]|nr:YqaJ viral recombinase family protein [Gemmatimonadota bacterium]
MTLTAEQLALRQTGIGASEIAAVAGLDPHRTPLDVWMLKRALTEPFAGNEFTRWGHRLEAVIAGAYADARGVLLDTRETLRHPNEPWMLATPDRVVLDPGGGEERLLQVKNRGLRQADRWGEPGTDQVPDEVAAQCHWEMTVTELDRCDVAVLIGGNDFRVYSLRRDPEIEAALVGIGRRFWFDHVVAGVRPEPTASDGAALARLFPTHNDLLLLAGPEHVTLATQLLDVRNRIAALEADREALEAHLKAAIGEHAGLDLPNGRITWKATRAARSTDWKAVVEDLRPFIEVDTAGATDTIIARHTTAKRGARRFLVSLKEAE